YCLLAGHPPFPGGTLGQKLFKHKTTEPTPIESLRGDLPPGLADVVRAMMAKAPEDRYQTAAAVADALADVLAGRAPFLPTPPRRPAEGFPWADLEPTTRVPFEPGAKRPARPLRKWLAMAGVLLVAGLTVLLVLSRGGGPASPTTSPHTDSPEEELNALQARFDEARDADAAALLQDLLAFHARYPGTELALKAAQLMQKLPSPLDQLGDVSIPRI